jgi:alkylation response protein AidB-like acyl-CoA dehydrogenase
MNYTQIDLLRFLMRDVHGLEQLFGLERFAHLDQSATDLLLTAARDYADTAMFPYFREMDAEPARWEDFRVKTHPQIAQIMRDAGENGWIGGRDDFDKGGMQLPETVYAFIHVIFEAANNAAQGYIALTGGAAHLITAFGSQELIDTYVPNMYNGVWQGTMALTEPQAGSSLTDITTSATPTDQGFYHIKGHKIFISGGDRSDCDNFVHLTLARIDGAPPGVKGISLFVVPRMRLDNGQLVYNDVQTAGDFQKMGQRGYSTTHLAYGDSGDCRGWLVGEPNKGLAYMFQMMNEARIGVGHTAAAVTHAAYLHALQYAKERPQGRLPGSRNPLDPPVLIIRHADVQRMLLTQQCIAEGSLSLTAECTMLADLYHAHPDEATRKQSLLLLEILTPVIKTYATEQGIRSVSLGLQVLGGYGYTMDFPLQQYYRDIRIMALYEGTTGIQSLDLLGRKVVMDNGAALQLLAERIGQTIQAAAQVPDFQLIAKQLGEELRRIDQVTRHLMQYVTAGQPERFTADATVYMEQFGTVVIAWQWLKIALKAYEALQMDGAAFDRTFYEEKLRCLKFFYRHELPHAAACATTLMQDEHVYELDK